MAFSKNDILQHNEILSHLYLQNSSNLSEELVSSDPKSLNVIVLEDEKEHEPFVSKILNAIPDVDDRLYKIIYVSSEKFPLNLSVLFSKRIHLLVFGISTKDLCLKIDQLLYTKLEFENTTLILADKLDEIQSNPEMKRQLWECIKNISLK